MDAWGFLLLPDPAPVLSEMHRVPRPGGRLVIQIGYHVPERPPSDTMRDRLRGTFWTWTEPEVRRICEEAGFTEVAVSYGSTAGDMRLFGHLARRFGVEESRIVRAVKAPSVRHAGSITEERAVSTG